MLCNAAQYLVMCWVQHDSGCNEFVQGGRQRQFHRPLGSLHSAPAAALTAGCMELQQQGRAPECPGPIHRPHTKLCRLYDTMSMDFWCVVVTISVFTVQIIVCSIIIKVHVCATNTLPRQSNNIHNLIQPSTRTS